MPSALPGQRLGAAHWARIRRGGLFWLLFGARTGSNLIGTWASSKGERERLAARREPQWHRLGKGCYLGFRRGPDTCRTRKGRPPKLRVRHVVLSAEDIKFFGEQTRDKVPRSPIFTEDGGAAVAPSSSFLVWRRSLCLRCTCACHKRDQLCVLVSRSSSVIGVSSSPGQVSVRCLRAVPQPHMSVRILGIQSRYASDRSDRRFVGVRDQSRDATAGKHHHQSAHERRRFHLL